MTVAVQVAALASRVANYIRDSILPRLLPSDGAALQWLRKNSGNTAVEWFTATSDAVSEGSTNLYFSLSRALGIVMTGMSTATSTAVAATDTLLVAIGKLQAQVALRATLATPTFTGTPSAPTAAITTDNTQLATTAFALIAAGTSQINSKSVDYTFVTADRGKTIYHPVSDTTARTWTIPANTIVAYGVGTAITLDNDFGAGVITININTDTLVMVGAAGGTGSRTLASGGRAVIQKVANSRWRISGIGLT